MGAEREVPGDVAESILARAAQLDAEGGDRAQLSELREAAREAGISGAAFDQAVREMVVRREPAVAARVGDLEGRADRRRTVLVAVATAFLVAAAIGALLVTWVPG